MLVYLKAILAGTIAGLSYAQAASDGGITQAEGIGIALATLVGLGVVGTVPNKQVRPAGDLEDAPQDDEA